MPVRSFHLCLLARQLREKVLDIPKLSSHFVELLTSTDLEPWGIELLLEMARKKNVTAWEFQTLGRGRVHAKISDMKLAELTEEVVVRPVEARAAQKKREKQGGGRGLTAQHAGTEHRFHIPLTS